MYFDFDYGFGANVEDVIIRPDSVEDPDTLHDFSKMLKIKNPAIQFKEQAKKGMFNDYSDQAYKSLLKDVKEFCNLFFHNEVSVNIFQLLADMTKYIFQNRRLLCSDEPESNEED